MTRVVGDDSASSRMLIARNAAEVVLYGIREIPIRFDRTGVADLIRQAVFCIYRALDAGSESLAQPEALGQASDLFCAARERLLQSAKKTHAANRSRFRHFSGCTNARASGVGGHRRRAIRPTFGIGLGGRRGIRQG